MDKVCTGEILLNTPDEELTEKERKWKQEQLSLDTLAERFCPFSGKSCRPDCAWIGNDYMCAVVNKCHS